MIAPDQIHAALRALAVLAARDAPGTAELLSDFREELRAQGRRRSGPYADAATAAVAGINAALTAYLASAEQVYARLTGPEPELPFDVAAEALAA